MSEDDHFLHTSSQISMADEMAKQASLRSEFSTAEDRLDINSSLTTEYRLDTNACLTTEDRLDINSCLTAKDRLFMNRCFDDRR